MRNSSLDELKGRIARGAYATDSGEIAGAILADFALVRRVRRVLMLDGEDGATERNGSGSEPRPRRRARLPFPRGRRSRSQRQQ